MSTLARHLRDRAQDDVRRMSAVERIALALRLGSEDLARFGQAQRLDVAEAERRMRAQRQRGRRPSRAATP